MILGTQEVLYEVLVVVLNKQVECSMVGSE